MRPRLSLLALTAAVVLAGCDAADPVEPDTSRRFRVEIANVAPAFGVLKRGVFNTPVGAAAPGPIGPGGAYEFSFTAGTNVTPGSGMRLSFATMFIQSNDLYYTFPGAGLALYDAQGNARTGDVTSEVRLYDAGTEVNEAPGVGANQAPRQGGANAGATENGTVVRINDGQADRAGFRYPNVADVIRVTLAHDGDTRFTVRIQNVSTMSTLALPGGGTVAVPLSPGGWVVHTDAVSFFASGAAASPGIEAIAEDGNPAPLDAALAPLTGVTVPLSPGTAAVHDAGVSFFTTGAAASAGLEDIAEDGTPDVLTAALTGLAGIRSALSFATPVGASGPAPIGPGGSYAFEVDAMPGERLSFATMYIQSNDFILAPEGAGIPLFTAAGAPVSGDVTAQVFLWDAGTEVDEEPGVGRHQATRQMGANSGPTENGVITRVMGMNDGYRYPAAAEVVRVTVTPLGS
jgi:hypothetical protein